MSRFLAILWVSLLPVVVTAQEKTAGYQFTVNGQPWEPTFLHLEGTPERPAPGDLVAVNNFWMVLGVEKVQAFHELGREDGILWQEKPGGGRRAAAAAVTWRFTEEKEADGRSKRVLHNPFRKLTPEDIRGLRAVFLDGWAEDLPQALAQLDLERVCFSLAGDAVAGPGRRLAPLPLHSRYIYVRENNNFQGILDYQPLAECKELRFLHVRSMTAAFDCRHIPASPHLTHLTLTAKSLRNLDSLGRLSGLRDLDLRYNWNAGDVAFAANLKKLERLTLSFTMVRDLSPLAGHPALQQIEANRTPLRKLPLDKPLPALRSLEALSTQVSDADAAAFAKLHPQCKVALRWDQSLVAALDGADRLRVRSGGTCHRNIPKERTLYEEKDPAKVRELIRQIKIDEKESGFHCMCCGEPSLEFYKNGKLLLTVGYHHGTGLRWVEGWPGDGKMTTACADHFQTWLAERIPALKKAQDDARQEAQQQKEEEEKFLRPFPEKVRPLLRGDGSLPLDDEQKKKGQRIAAAVGEEKALALALCRAFGALEEGGYSTASWSMSTDKERNAAAAAQSLQGPAFLLALQTLQGERRALLGAARLFFADGLDRLLSPEERAAWTIRLAELYLQEGYSENKFTVLSRLGKCADDGTQTLLRQVLRGQKGKEDKRSYGAEPGLQAHAALCLAQRRDASIKSEVEKLLNQAQNSMDKAACQVALALLGDPTQLRAEHFTMQSYAIGLGAVRAVEQFGGVHGLDLLVDKGLEHPWAYVRDEAQHALERITGKKWPEYDSKAVKAWWKAQGPAFVEQRRKERQAKP